MYMHTEFLSSLERYRGETQIWDTKLAGTKFSVEKKKKFCRNKSEQNKNKYLETNLNQTVSQKKWNKFKP